MVLRVTNYTLTQIILQRIGKKTHNLIMYERYLEITKYYKK